MAPNLRTGDQQENEEAPNGQLIGANGSSNSSKIQQIWNNRWSKVALFVIVVLLISLAISLPFSAWKYDPTSTGILYDCHPDQGVSDDVMSKNCKERGCVWSGGRVKGDSNAPKCYYPDDYENYKVDYVSLVGHMHYFIYLNKTSRPSGFTDDSERVVVEIRGINDDLIRVRVTDAAEKRWEPPLPLLDIDPKSEPTESHKYNLTNDWKHWTITRRDTGSVIFDTDWSKLIYSRQFIQMTSKVTSKSLYGLGESMNPHEKSVNGLADPNERKNFLFLNYGTAPSKSSYGSHPFYLMYEGNDTEVAHGVLLLNFNPMDITYTQTPALTYRTIGGVLDFLIFMGPTALDVLQQKADVIGHAPMPPYWSLGFHLCKYGYESDQEIRETFDANTAAGVPIDVQWADIDYMDHYNMFTWDKVNYAGLPELIEYLHENGRKFVPILDPAIAYDTNVSSPGYAAFHEGEKLGIFVTNTSKQLLLTKMWNPVSVIPDFTHPDAKGWWNHQIDLLFKDIHFDGLWIDMNEPAMMGHDGQIGGCVNNSLDRPQYNPSFPNVLESETICMSSQHHLGPHYNIHNVYSLFQAKMTFEKLQDLHKNKRPFLLSRASTTGQGRYSSHWTGDITSSWEHMANSVKTMLDFNLFGIPLVGADICGFVGNTTEEMCARWHALGAFYTFSRNHNMRDTIKQDPASMGELVTAAATYNLNIRYTLLPYLYTMFYFNSKTGHPVVRSLKLNFPQDPATNSIDNQFMWGEGIMFTPILEPDTYQIDAYFPAGTWYDYVRRSPFFTANGTTESLIIVTTLIGIHVRGGSIIPTIPSMNKTTMDHLSDPSFSIITALDDKGHADGHLYWDDGESADAASRRKYSLIHFAVKEDRKFVSEVVNKNEDIEMLVKDVQVWGLKENVTHVLFSDPSVHEQELSFKMIETNMSLHIDLPSNTSLLNPFEIRWTS